jgi:hypothetical protein
MSLLRRNQITAIIGIGAICVPVFNTTAFAKFPKIHSPVIHGHPLKLPKIGGAVGEAATHVGQQFDKHKKEVITITVLAVAGAGVGFLACAAGCTVVGSAFGLSAAAGTVGAPGGAAIGAGLGAAAGAAISSSAGGGSLPANQARGLPEPGESPTPGSGAVSRQPEPNPQGTPVASENGGELEVFSGSAQSIDPNTLPWDPGKLLMSQPFTPCSDGVVSTQQKDATNKAITSGQVPQNAVGLFAISVGCFSPPEKPDSWNRDEEVNARLNSLLLAATKTDTPVFALLPDKPESSTTSEVRPISNFKSFTWKSFDTLTDTIEMKEELLANLTNMSPDQVATLVEQGIDKDLAAQKSAGIASASNRS